MSVDDAFQLLRSYARSHGDHLTEVSRRLIAEPEARPAILGAMTQMVAALLRDVRRSRIRGSAILEELHRQADTPPTMGELAETLVLDRSAPGHNLRPLERDGLIALVAGDNDRRRRRVVLTTTGHAKFAQARQAWKLAQDRFNDVFGESAAAKLRATLLRIARDERLTTLTD